MDYGDEARFYGFRVFTPVGFDPHVDTALFPMDNGSTLRVKRPTRGRILRATVLLGVGDFGVAGDDGMDLATRLEWLAVQQGAVTMPMIQNKIQVGSPTASVSADRPAGQTAILVAHSNGLVSPGRYISFSNHSRIYKVTRSTESTLQFAPALFVDVPTGATVNLSPDLSFFMTSSPVLTYPASGPLEKQVELTEAV